MLYGQRVTLRRVVEEDWEKRYEWLSDPVVNRTLPSGSGMPLTPEVVRERTRKYAQTDLSSVYFTIIKEDGIPIGNTQLFNIHPWSKHAEFGIWIGDKMVWGQGYATEVTGVVLDFAFERLNLHKVYLTVDGDNPAAIRSYEKAGFNKDGILRDEVYKNGQYVNRIMMSILKHEYLKLSSCSKKQSI